jgi:hypothetical protein
MTLESFIFKNKIVDLSPKKNSWENTSSEWHRNASETAYRLPKENRTNFLRRLTRNIECTQLHLIPTEFM